MREWHDLIHFVDPGPFCDNLPDNEPIHWSRWPGRPHYSRMLAGASRLDHGLDQTKGPPDAVFVPRVGTVVRKTRRAADRVVVVVGIVGIELIRRRRRDAGAAFVSRVRK